VTETPRLRANDIPRPDQNNRANNRASDPVQIGGPQAQATVWGLALLIADWGTTPNERLVATVLPGLGLGGPQTWQHDSFKKQGANV
jgi:hypothetical protein